MNIIKLLLITLTINLFANNNITLKWLDKKPRTIAKDFYILQYLKQDITGNQASKALGQVRNMNWKLLYAYAKHTKDKDFQYVINCKKAKTNELVNKDATCINIGMSMYDATKLNNKQLKKVISKLKKPYSKSAKKFEIINTKSPFKKLIASDKEIFFGIFNQCGTKFRISKFNYKLSQTTLKKLVNDKSFQTTLKLIVTTPKLTNLQKSIFNIKDTKKLSHLSLFYLAINAINHKKKKQALKYLKLAHKKAYYQFDKDKVTFWQYQISKNSQIIMDLSKSGDINIYSLYALELINEKPKNIIYKIKQSKKKSHFDTSTPFTWLPILRDSRKMSKKKYKKYQNLFTQNKTQPHLAFVSERYLKYKKSYFITPYEKILKGIKPKRKALIYALARQESKFIPTSISTSYAMGVMQIMPFLSKAIALELKEPYNIYDQLNPTINLKYANHHLNYLEKRMKHPLFISYAYNGGIGFTKRTVLKKYFTNKKYDPYLSMEMIPYDETRKYGKKVLANYYIYANYFGIKTTMQDLFREVSQRKK